MDNRQQQLETWLSTALKSAKFTLTTASADASFRRYFRVHVADKTLIAMDAPPTHESCAPFVQVAQLLAEAGLNAPNVLAQDLAQGFLLLSDLGDDTYLSKLNEKTAPELYKNATDALIKMQGISVTGVLPNYDAAMLGREMQLFPDWYVAQHLKASLTPLAY